MTLSNEYKKLKLKRVSYDKYDKDPEYIKKYNVGNTVKDGQRKLLFEVLQFLTDYIRKDDIIIYVGSAPGFNINLLCEMFPDNKFILYDKLDIKVYSQNAIKIQEYFSDEEAKKYIKDADKILFISDIRNLEIGNMVKNNQSNQKIDALKVNDQDLQLRWINIIKPRISSLKLSFTYSGFDFMYPKGDLYTQIYSPNSNECRLIVERKNINNLIKYNSQKFDDEFFYYNTQIRTQPTKYYKNIIDKLQLINTYDIAMEIKLIEDYIKKILKIKNKKEIENKIINLHFYFTIYLKQFTTLKLLYQKPFDKIVDELKKQGILKL